MVTMTFVVVDVVVVVVTDFACDGAVMHSDCAVIAQ